MSRRDRHASSAPQPFSSAAGVTVTVAWHDDSADGAFLAREIFRWLRGDPRDLDACGAGIPVFFRAGRNGVPVVELDPREQGTRVAVLLIDEHFAASKEMRAFAHALVERGVARARKRDGHRPLVLPVALHPGAYEIAGRLSLLNFLRADRGPAPADETEDARRRRRVVALRRQLTDALGRLLRASNDGFAIDQFEAPPAPVDVFLSHAKADGRDEALQLRDALQRRGQMRVFFDEHDLAYGFDYVRGLQEALAVGHAAMVVVLSDQYASRPWCRHELHRMRSLQWRKGRVNGGRVGVAAPLVVVDALEQRSHDLLPDLGGASVVRWRDGAGDAVADLVLREVLQSAFEVQRAFDVQQRCQQAGRPVPWCLAALPDASRLAQAQAEIDAAADGAAAARAAVSSTPVLVRSAFVPADTARYWQTLFPRLELHAIEDFGS